MSIVQKPRRLKLGYHIRRVVPNSGCPYRPTMILRPAVAHGISRENRRMLAPTARPGNRQIHPGGTDNVRAAITLQTRVS